MMRQVITRIVHHTEYVIHYTFWRGGIFMAIEVRKKDRESSSSMLRRFVRRVQQSRVLVNARHGRFYDKGQTKRQKKNSALRREELKKLRSKLYKAGQIKEGEMIPKETVRRYLGK